LRSSHSLAPKSGNCRTYPSAIWQKTEGSIKRWKCRNSGRRASPLRERGAAGKEENQISGRFRKPPGVWSQKRGTRMLASRFVYPRKSAASASSAFHITGRWCGAFIFHHAEAWCCFHVL
jgi:hypothetical protein